MDAVLGLVEGLEVDPPAVVAEGESGGEDVIPDIAGGGLSGALGAFVVVEAAASGVAVGPHAVDIRRGDSG